MSTATGIDISNFPFFGPLVIPEIGFTISSEFISNPLLSGIYRPGSFLANFGDRLSKGVTASFSISLETAKNIKADFSNSELELSIPENIEFTLGDTLNIIPGARDVLDQLPSVLQDIINTRIHKIYYSPKVRTLQFLGALDSLTVLPHILSLTDIDFEFSGVIGNKPTLNFAKFEGKWMLHSLLLTTEVIYEKMLLFEAYATKEMSERFCEVFYRNRNHAHSTSTHYLKINTRHWEG